MDGSTAVERGGGVAWGAPASDAPGAGDPAARRWSQWAGRWMPRLKAAGSAEDAASRFAARFLVATLFLRLCERAGLEPAGQLAELADRADGVRRLRSRFRRARRRFRAELFPVDEVPDDSDSSLLLDVVREVATAGEDGPLNRADPALLGRVYEAAAGGPSSRKAKGVYYTPDAVVDHVVRSTVATALAAPRRTRGNRPDLLPTVCDPACGGGAFLLKAYDAMVSECHDYGTSAGGPRVHAADRRRLALACLHGVDIDPWAVEVARLSLVLRMLVDDPDARLDKAILQVWAAVRCGNALVGAGFGPESGARDPSARDADAGFDWQQAFPAVAVRGGFDIVLGNPPWGQKAIHADSAVRRHLRECYESLAGIFDLFRPFVERGIRLTAPGGRFGMVLPDIVLLKDYEATRRFILDHLRLTHVDWWGMAFDGAVIDAATVVGVRGEAPADHAVRVHVRDRRRPLAHEVRQADFRSNPRCTFNLHLTAAKRSVLRRLAACPRLGDYFEIHEGVHTGNLRNELIVDEPIDETSRPLFLGRDEITPYRLRWAGRYLRLGAVPARRRSDGYANAGRPEWYASPKVLVRRTGDFVLAAVDEEGRYATNNFFVVFAKRACSLDVHGLCVVLNSELVTWWFRTVEPRRGRAFAELKIKHLREVPLPPCAAGADAVAGAKFDSRDCARLNADGRALAASADGGGAASVDVGRLYPLTAVDLAVVRREALGDTAIDPASHRADEPVAGST